MKLGSIPPATAGLLVGELNLIDADGNLCNAATSVSVSVYATGSGEPITSGVTASFTAVSGTDETAGLYKLEVSITSLSSGTYSVRCTSGSIGSPAVSIIGIVLATFIVQTETSQIDATTGWGGSPLPTLSPSGNGTVSYPIGPYATYGGQPLQGVAVTLYTDADMTQLVAETSTQYTDSTGTVTFNLNRGTYYVKGLLTGYNITNPTRIIV